MPVTYARLTAEDVQRLLGLLVVDPVSRRNRFEALRESSRAQTEHLVEVFGDVLAAVREAMAATEGVGFLRAVRRRTGELIPDHLDGEPVDLSFASAAWQQILRERRRPSRLVRRHFEAWVFSYLAAELRSGDIAVRGSESFANLHEQLLTWSECQPRLTDFCAEVGLPAGRPDWQSQVASSAKPTFSLVRGFLVRGEGARPY